MSQENKVKAVTVDEKIDNITEAIADQKSDTVTVIEKAKSPAKKLSKNKAKKAKRNALLKAEKKKQKTEKKSVTVEKQKTDKKSVTAKGRKRSDMGKDRFDFSDIIQYREMLYSSAIKRYHPNGFKPFDNSLGSRDAEASLVVASYLLKGKVQAFSKNQYYACVAEISKTSIEALKKDSACDAPLHKGIYRISMLPKGSSADDVVYGGIFLLRTESIGWVSGYYLKRPNTKYKLPTPEKLKSACKYLADRQTGKLKQEKE